MSRSQHTATSQSFTTFSQRLATTSSSDTAAASGRATLHRDRVEPSRRLVQNDDTNSGNESDDESEASDNAIQPQARAKRNSKKTHDPYPHQLGFYSGTWHDLLVEAKNRYRLFIHTQNPFPERNRNGLRDANDCLLEIISKYKDDGVQLDEGTVNNQLTLLLLII